HRLEAQQAAIEIAMLPDYFLEGRARHRFQTFERDACILVRSRVGVPAPIADHVGIGRDDELISERGDEIAPAHEKSGADATSCGADDADRGRALYGLAHPPVVFQTSIAENLLQLSIGRIRLDEGLLGLVEGQFEPAAWLQAEERGPQRLDDAAASIALLVELPKIGELTQRAGKRERIRVSASHIGTDMHLDRLEVAQSEIRFRA